MHIFYTTACFCSPSTYHSLRLGRLETEATGIDKTTDLSTPQRQKCMFFLQNCRYKGGGQS